MEEEGFLRLLEQLKQEVVIVEGKKDKEALKTLGLKRIIAINSKPLIEIVDKIQKIGCKQVVLLTDFDKQGRKIEAKLRNLLQKHKIQSNRKLRWHVMNLGKNRIEDFRNFLGKGINNNEIEFGGDVHGEISANFNKIYNKSKNKSKRGNRKTGRHRSYLRSDRRASGF